MDRKPAPGGWPWLPLPSVIGGAGPGPQPSGCGRDRELVERGGVEAWGRVARDRSLSLSIFYISYKRSQKICILWVLAFFLAQHNVCLLICCCMNQQFVLLYY